MNLQLGIHLPGCPIRGWQLGALFLPYGLVIFITSGAWAYTSEARWLLSALGLLLLGMLVVIWITGLVHFFPVWTLPAMAVVLFLVTGFFTITAQILMYPILELFLERIFVRTGHISLLRNLGLMLLAQLMFLVITVLLVAGLLRLVPSFYRQVLQEWTLLSFLLYGIAILPIVENDEYVGMGMYQTASLLVLMIGMVIYLTASQRWQRWWALVIPAVLSSLLISLGQYLTFPMQSWVNSGDELLRMWEALQPVLSLFPLSILLILAALVPRLPINMNREEALSS